jgi:aminopeptidase N
LPDFVGAINDAFKAHGGSPLLGESFDLVEWCDQWLTTSGINVLEPVFEYQGDNLSLKIKQTNDLRGKNRLRKQKIDVGIYDEHFQLTTVKDVVISEIDEVVDVPLENFNKPHSMIILNLNDHGYAKVRFD